jgi:hypothetical protein
MSFDLAISEHGDLVLSGNRDLSGISGEDLLNQRIMLRLRLHRGTWFYDEQGTLGSNLHKVMINSADKDLQIEGRVQEALAEMADEIDIIQVDSKYREDEKSVFVSLVYSTKVDSSQLGTGDETDTQIQLRVPLGG